MNASESPPPITHSLRWQLLLPTTVQHPQCPLSQGMSWLLTSSDLSFVKYFLMYLRFSLCARDIFYGFNLNGPFNCTIFDLKYAGPPGPETLSCYTIHLLKSILFAYPLIMRQPPCVAIQSPNSNLRIQAFSSNAFTHIWLWRIVGTDLLCLLCPVFFLDPLGKQRHSPETIPTKETHQG